MNIYHLLGFTLILSFSGTLGNSPRKVNKCGRDVSSYTTYLNESFELPISRIADVILSDGVYTSTHKHVYHKTKYHQLANSFFDISPTEWKPKADGWMSRNISFKRHVNDGNPLVKVASMLENHLAKYTTQQLILSKYVHNLDTFTSGIAIEGEYCVTVEGNRSHMQVDMKLSINSFLSLFSDSIEESSNNGFIEVYGSLSLLLHYLETYKEYSVEPVPFAPIEVVNLEIQEKLARAQEEENSTTKLGWRLPTMDPVEFAKFRATRVMHKLDKDVETELVIPVNVDDTPVKIVEEKNPIGASDEENDGDKNFFVWFSLGIMLIAVVALAWFAYPHAKDYMRKLRLQRENRSAMIALNSPGLD